MIYKFRQMHANYSIIFNASRPSVSFFAHSMKIDSVPSSVD